MPRLSIAALSAAVFAVLASEPAKDFTPLQKRLWSLQPVTKPAEPAVRNSAWPRTRIDRFILARLEEKQIKPNPPADKITLLRRVTLDLTGLLPSLEETQAFLADASPTAFETAVDRLLASPRYGERWGRHWLDVVRYADSNGFKADETRPNIWRYRDYVIRSFNDDKPYDRFVQEQLAGDEMFPGDLNALIATGYLRHFPDEYNARNLFQRRQEILNDITDNAGSAFLGMTVGCARCHDHKFDPILQRDYYRLQAFFSATHVEDKTPLLAPAELKAWQSRRAGWEEKTREIRAEMSLLAKPAWNAKYQDDFEKYPEEIQAAITAEASKRTPVQWQMFYQSRIQLDISEETAAKSLKGANARRYQELQQQLAAFDSLKPAELPLVEAMIESGAAPPKSYLLNAGAYDAPRDEVQPGFLTILAPGNAQIEAVAGSSGRRTALARWLTSPANPLTARVIVNRVWQAHFGRGIAGTPNDFGIMGERPTHRELLDDLAARFQENGWSLKRLHREIVLSAAYRQSSQWRADAGAADPGSKLLWRFPRRRLEGEAVRDSMLQVSGLLNTKMFGPGVFPPLPPGVSTRGGWNAKEEPLEAARRSVYVFVRRNTRYPILEAFDFPDTHESCARRNETVTPFQALEMMNNELVLDWSKALAARVLNDTGLPPPAQIDRAWRLVYQRPATAEEQRSALAFLDRHTPLAASREKAFIDLCHTLLNSNEFVTLN